LQVSNNDYHKMIKEDHTPIGNYCRTIILTLILLGAGSLASTAQLGVSNKRMLFISDTQAPLAAEKLVLHAYRNEEARDSLFADIIRSRPANLFMLGDLESRGSNEKSWSPLDNFLGSMKRINARVYALPGNHEYMGFSHNGIALFRSRFGDEELNGYSAIIDSVAVVMINSNFGKMGDKALSDELLWYSDKMRTLDYDPAVRAIIVCTHHAPFSNSRIVGSSQPVAERIVPVFEKTKKARLFLSGHSHNLECFGGPEEKHFMVIGGGGGIAQPLEPEDKCIKKDLLRQDEKPVNFYIIIERNGNKLNVTVRGFKKDFHFYNLDLRY
jgi:hypothetical protein